MRVSYAAAYDQIPDQSNKLGAVAATSYGSTAATVSIPSILTLAFALSNTCGPEEGDGIPELAIKVAKNVVRIHSYWSA